MSTVDALGGKLKFHKRHPGLLEVLEEAHFGWLEEHEAFALAAGTCCPADAVDVVAGII